MRSSSKVSAIYCTFDSRILHCSFKRETNMSIVNDPWTSTHFHILLSYVFELSRYTTINNFSTYILGGRRLLCQNRMICKRSYGDGLPFPIILQTSEASVRIRYVHRFFGILKGHLKVVSFNTMEIVSIYKYIYIFLSREKKSILICTKTRRQLKRLTFNNDRSSIATGSHQWTIRTNWEQGWKSRWRNGDSRETSHRVDFER